MATMIICSQCDNINLARSREVSTAQVHDKYAIHKDPHVIVTSKFEHFRIKQSGGIILV